jgi:hypothetical protein
LTTNNLFNNSSAPNFGMLQITFDTVDYDPNGKWNVQENAFDIVGGTVWEIGATVTTYSWIDRAILHIVDTTNNRTIKSVMCGSTSTDYEESISVNCIFKPQDNVRVAIFIEGTGTSWTVAGDYGPSTSDQPNFNSTKITYFWIHQIA